jgi:apolipoprotein N-acyltransferase
VGGPRRRLASEALSRRALIGVVLVLATAPLALAAGHWRLATASTAMFENVSLRVVQANVAQGDKWVPEHRDEIVAAHLDLSTSGGLAGVTHLVWPESAVPMLIDEEPQAREQLVGALPDDVTLLLGALRRELHDPAGTPSVRIYNSLFAVSGAGDILARYDKWRLVPFGEYLPFAALLEPLGLRQFVPLPLGFSAGPAPRTLTIDGTPGFAPLICYEAIFPRALIDRGDRPEWLLNVTNDGWFGNTAGPYQHLEQARFRAIEEGLALVRAANTGISAVIDPYGRILDRLPLGEAGRFDSPLPRPLPRRCMRSGETCRFFSCWYCPACWRWYTKNLAICSRICTIEGCSCIGCHFCRTKQFSCSCPVRLGCGTPTFPQRLFTAKGASGAWAGALTLRQGKRRSP